MNILTTDYNTLTLVLTFIPVMLSAVFAALCFHRLVYGTIGKLMVLGLCVIVVSLVSGLMFNAVTPRDYVYQAVAGTLRLFGWSMIALGFIVWFVEIDRSVP